MAKTIPGYTKLMSW